VLLAADYSQIELRLLAHMSEDSDLVASFRAGEDVHRRTASEVFGIPADQVDDRSRSIAKAINFGLMYGKTAFGLSQELKIPRREAQDTIDRYFRRYAGVKRFLDGQIEFAREHAYTVTLMGRRRPLPDIHSKNAAVRANAERIAMNAPIQGTAADLMKLAMIVIDEELTTKFPRTRLLLQVHDEVVLDVPRSEANAVERMVVEKMERALELSVPLVVNSALGENWMEI
jgi:DNA polymerase-1